MGELDRPGSPESGAHAAVRVISRHAIAKPDPRGVRILFVLDPVNELCVGDLALTVGSSEDAVGYGLRLSRTAGLVQTRKDGRVMYYRLADSFPEPLLEHCLHQLIYLARVAADGGRGENSHRTSRARKATR